jgi:hypothetical protein
MKSDKFKTRKGRKFLGKGDAFVSREISASSFKRAHDKKVLRYVDGEVCISNGYRTISFHIEGEAGAKELSRLVGELSIALNDVIAANNWKKNGGKN